jgi:hypothetical protein
MPREYSVPISLTLGSRLAPDPGLSPPTMNCANDPPIFLKRETHRSPRQNLIDAMGGQSGAHGLGFSALLKA